MRSFADIESPEDAKAFLLEHVKVCAAHRSVLAFTMYWSNNTASVMEKVANRCLICADINYQAGRAYGGRMSVLKNRGRTSTRLTLLWDADWAARGLTR
jgi:hypothetical protein